MGQRAKAVWEWPHPLGMYGVMSGAGCADLAPPLVAPLLAKVWSGLLSSPLRLWCYRLLGSCNSLNQE